MLKVYSLHEVLIVNVFIILLKRCLWFWFRLSYLTISLFCIGVSIDRTRHEASAIVFTQPGFNSSSCVYKYQDQTMEIDQPHTYKK